MSTSQMWVGPNLTERDGLDTVENVVRFIEKEQHRFYRQEGHSTAWVAVRASPTGQKFIQTHADGIWNDNLLALKECST